MGTPPPAPRRAPPPLQVDTVRVVWLGTALWAAALLVLLVLGDRVDRVWSWTCVAGIALAGIGLGIMRFQGVLGRGRAGPGRRADERPGGRGRAVR